MHDAVEHNEESLPYVYCRELRPRDLPKGGYRPPNLILHGYRTLTLSHRNLIVFRPAFATTRTYPGSSHVHGRSRRTAWLSHFSHIKSLNA